MVTASDVSVSGGVTKIEARSMSAEYFLSHCEKIPEELSLDQVKAGYFGAY